MPATLPGGHQVATYVDEHVARRIDEAAQAEGLSRAAWMRTRLLRALVAEAPPLTADQIATLRAAGLRFGGDAA